MKIFSIILFLFFSLNNIIAQQDSGVLNSKDTNGKQQNETVVKKENIKANEKLIDTLNIQQNDSVLKAKSIVRINKDSIIEIAKIANKKSYDSLLSTIGLPIFSPPVYMLTQERSQQEYGELFYIILFIIFLLALVKFFFPNFLQNTKALFFQTTGANTNTKYLVQQQGFAFILMQLVFVLCGGVYITLIAIKQYKYQFSLWETLLFSSVFLGIVYFGKYIAIKILGWLFDLQNEAKIYLLFVFLVNRVVSVFLIPVVLVLAFSNEEITGFFFIFSIILIGLFFLYRYYLTIKTVQPQTHIKTIQIFLYLCTVEILPIVLLYKLIVDYTNGVNYFI